MIRKPRVGLLPLYLELYDDCRPEMRRGFDGFLQQVQSGLADRGLELTVAPICRVAPEFAAAFEQFAAAEVDLIVTLHLAYSASLESVDMLCGVDRPLLMLDTTMDHDFGRDIDPARLSYNHGIHGVQDLACMLRRRGRAYVIVAGHVTESNVLDRAADVARAAYAARCLRSSRTLRIGESFRGMGDFAVEADVLQRRLDVSVVQIAPGDLAKAVDRVTDEMIDGEVASDSERFEVDLDGAVHRRSVRVGLGLRRYLEAGGYDAFSQNFLAFDSTDGPVDTVPFLEASKAMARGIGYAGEGDVLTAALVGALIRGFGQVTFTEIFCPDWKGNTLFLSHMGEINPVVAANRPCVLERDFPYAACENPAYLACAVRPGPAVLVNLAPGPGETFRLIVAPVDVLADGTHPDMRKSVRGWIRPRCGVAEFLERYSRLGGTHHSALVLGDHAEALTVFGGFVGIECNVVR
jgi:L-arabinose isomerase